MMPPKFKHSDHHIIRGNITPGRRKKHTLKVEIMTDTKGKILSVSKVVPGRMHDFSLRKQSSKIPRNAMVLADSGYQGLQKIHPKTILPHKRRRKCALTSEQKAHNTILASERIVVERDRKRICVNRSNYIKVEEMKLWSLQK